MTRTSVTRKSMTRITPGFLTLLLIGLMNTVFLKPEDVGSWREPVGVVLLVLAIVYAFVLVLSWRRNGALEKDALG